MSRTSDTPLAPTEGAAARTAIAIMATHTPILRASPLCRINSGRPPSMLKVDRTRVLGRPHRGFRTDRHGALQKPNRREHEEHELEIFRLPVLHHRLAERCWVGRCRRRTSGVCAEGTRTAICSTHREQIDQAFRESLDEEFELRLPPDYPEGELVFRGRDGFSQVIGLLQDSWRQWRFEPERFLDAGDQVVVFARIAGSGDRSNWRSRTSGRFAPVASPPCTRTGSAPKPSKRPGCGSRR